MFSWTSPMAGDARPGRYRLVAVDLDSSLQPDGGLHEADASALRAAHAAGVKVVLVSALPPQVMHRYWAQLGLGAPIIALNGALVYDFPSHRPVVGQPLEPEQVQRILQVARATAPQAAIAVQQRETWLANHLGRAAKEMIQRTGIWPSYLGDLSSQLSDETYQVWVSADADQLAALEAGLAHAGLSLAHYTHPQRLAMQVASASRGWALSALANVLEVAPDEVMAVGGGGQDRSMLQAAAFAVLVSDLAKEMESPSGSEAIAKTPGVAEALARYLAVEASEVEPWPSIEP